MAISATDYFVIRELAKAKVIPSQPDVLELGEANWYGDVDIRQLAEDIPKFAAKENQYELLLQLKNLVANLSTEGVFFDIAKVFYMTFLGYHGITAIDLNGTTNALRYNLNDPLPMDRQFHILINNGTAEHVFNVCQFLKSSHERTYPGGLMIHAFPFVGLLDHGFYNFNPTFIADLAAANQYDILLWIYSESTSLRPVPIVNIEQVHEMKKQGEVHDNAMQHVVLRKPQEEQPFVVPMQGYYSGHISTSSRDDWEKLR